MNFRFIPSFLILTGLFNLNFLFMSNKVYSQDIGINIDISADEALKEIIKSINQYNEIVPVYRGSPNRRVRKITKLLKKNPSINIANTRDFIRSRLPFYILNTNCLLTEYENPVGSLHVFIYCCKYDKTLNCEDIETGGSYESIYVNFWNTYSIKRLRETIDKIEEYCGIHSTNSRCEQLIDFHID